MTGQDPEPPMVEYKRQTNIRDRIIKAKIPAKFTRAQRSIPGMKKCGNCVVCPYVKEGNQVKSKTKTWNLVKPFNCVTKNVVYFIECQKERCKNGDKYIYIGETGKQIETRIRQHLGYIRNKEIRQSTGSHFNKQGHSQDDMKFTVLKQSKSLDIVYRK